MFKAIRHQVPANKGKEEKARGLLAPFRDALCKIVAITDKEFQQGNPLPLYTSLKPSDLDSKLSARQVQTSFTQAIESMKSWHSWLEKEFRKIVTDSSLDGFTKMVLYRINLQHAWYEDGLSFDWTLDETGELVPYSKKKDKGQPADHKTVLTLPISEEMRRLSLKLIKQARKRRTRPDLSRVRTLRLDAKVAPLQEGSNSFNYWVKLSTMEKGKPIYLPLSNNPYFNEQLSAGKLKGQIQLTFMDDSITVSPVIEQPDAPMRDIGDILCLDWGAASLFSTSAGQLLGQSCLVHLRELDISLMDLQATIEKSGGRLKDDPRYKSLYARITAMVKNEVGRILNRLAADDIKELVVRKPVFRHAGLSNRMNWIVSHAGKKVFEVKLSRLTEEFGIAVTHVFAAYANDECSVCGCVEKKNRKSYSLFVCQCCGNKLHADINASRSIRLRRSQPVPLDKSTQKNLLGGLLERHAQHCPSGLHRATAGNIGPDRKRLAA